MILRGSCLTALLVFAFSCIVSFVSFTLAWSSGGFSGSIPVQEGTATFSSDRWFS